MKLIRSLFWNLSYFFKDMFRYLRDAIAIHLLIVLFFLPALLRASRWFLRSSEVPFLSIITIQTAFFHHPLPLLGLLFCGILVIFVVYFEYFFLLLSMYFIKKKTPIRIRTLLWMTVLEMKKVRPSVFFFFLFYFFLILPFGGLAAHLDILSTIRLPSFLMEFIFTNRKILLYGWGIWYFFCLYLGIRFIFVIPKLILENRSLKSAVHESFVLTKRNFFPLIVQFFAIALAVLGSYSLVIFLLINGQRLVERYVFYGQLASAFFVMILLQIASILNLVLSMVMMNSVILGYLEEEGKLPEVPSWISRKSYTSSLSNFSAGLLLLVVAGSGFFLGNYDVDYLRESHLSTPLLYCHRGVNENQGVQNTIPSLRKVMKFQPSFVEIDVQETKDHEFVLMHDKLLTELSGQDVQIRELTLKEIKQLTVEENGEEASIPTLDEYLKVANEKNQKLMIEIKEYQTFSPALVQRFLEKYGDEILKNQYRVQSLSYPVVEEVKRRNPKIYVSYILPFNLLGPPETSADAYTMEFSTLNSGFVNEAHQSKKQVIAWTVNSKDSLLRMSSLRVDGVITDSVERLKKDLRKNQQEMPYSEKLLIYSLGLDLQ